MIAFVLRALSAACLSFSILCFAAVFDGGSTLADPPLVNDCPGAPPCPRRCTLPYPTCTLEMVGNECNCR